jgi:DNA-binding XRE family transcriptional regulator
MIQNDEMKTEPNRTITKLRKIIEKTQEQFAVMLGVSKDTIVSVENGRNRLTSRLAKRIYIATGALPSSLEDNTGEVLAQDHATRGPVMPYTKDYFDRWRKIAMGVVGDDPVSRDKTAESMFDLTKDRIEVLLVAATRPGITDRDRFPAVLQSLDEWIDATYHDFGLAAEVDAVIRERTYEKGKGSFTVGMVRQCIAEGGPCHFRFKDSKKLQDSDKVELEYEFYYKWTDEMSVFPRPKRIKPKPQKTRPWDFSSLFKDKALQQG